MQQRADQPFQDFVILLQESTEQVVIIDKNKSTTPQQADGSSNLQRSIAAGYVTHAAVANMSKPTSVGFKQPFGSLLVGIKEFR